MKNIFQRFGLEIDRLGGASVIAAKLGIAKGTVYNWREKHNIPLDRLAELQDMGLDASFVFSGSESPIAVQDIEQGAIGEDFATVPRYAVTASAGFGRLAAAEDVIGSLCFSRKWLQKRGCLPAIWR